MDLKFNVKFVLYSRRFLTKIANKFQFLLFSIPTTFVFYFDWFIIWIVL